MMYLVVPLMMVPATTQLDKRLEKLEKLTHSGPQRGEWALESGEQGFCHLR